MDLKELLKKEKEPRAAWIPFKGFEFKLLYVDRAELLKLIDRSTIKTWKRHQQTETVDDNLMLKNLSTLILDWRGLTLGILATLLDIDIEGQDPKQSIPCDENNKVVLLENLYDLDNFLYETTTDLQVFRAAEMKAEKKTL